ncbi:dihydrolipoyl dehydrogenase [Sandaracinobacteroides saxicola]|uniref:Dihydrolipoyl dehydrogenase n=1 Tax=Sandaracinobacteroides saxicola TaxID=2759707 RepID=A0A7G5IHC4_9SPHN|nr:dihydrolipoyl dehydrogenase [Sandaracinobacteroides saxicola]QMW22766.1 dihydrolipoyl dehydrogenase [Sandaracinobacteroides saxicola]
MTPDFDVIIIGAGPGGYVAAIRAAQLGLKTACVEKRATLGGTCLNVGCIPSKALLHASELYEEAAHGAMAKFGVKLSGVELDLPAMQAEKAKAVKELTGGVEFLFKKNKVEWVKGAAAFVDARTIMVGERRLTARNFIIATGSEVALIPGVVPDGEVIVTSTEALELPRVPGHLVVVGGGYIGLEMGSVWRRLGAKVTVVEYMPTITPNMDREITAEFAKILVKQGMVLKTGTKVAKIERKGAGATLTLEPAAGGAAETLDADIVLLSIGRRPNTDGLALDKAGLALDGKGRIPTNPDFSTAVPGIWAIGDVIEGPMLAHKAEDEGVACAENIAGLHGHVNHAVIPAVVYTQPEVASVGLTQEEAEAAGHALKIGKFPFAANSRSKANRDTLGLVKIIADAKTDRVLGVHIIGRMAGTMIAQAAQAMEFGASSEDIAYTCHAHPTHNEAMKEAAMAVRGKPIHI